MEERELTCVYEGMSGRWVRDGHEADEGSEIQKPVQRCLLQSLWYPGLDMSLKALPEIVITLRVWWNPGLHYSLILKRLLTICDSGVCEFPGLRTGPQQHLWTARSLLSRLNFGLCKHDLSHVFMARNSLPLSADVSLADLWMPEVYFFKSKLVCSLICAYC